jgi:aspartyl-tRNA(Asn)/glutamyl-tRNA(Gln) amidotransferase subunit A
MPINLTSGIAELSNEIKRGEVSPVELTEFYLSRIHEFNGKLNAFLTVSADLAHKAAKQADEEIRSGKYRGPLHGIPIAIKDMLDTSGIRTTYGSTVFRNNIPERDAFVVARLKEAGAVILGKTNTDEFALGAATNNPHYGATNNPWCIDRTPGGSSGGSTAAVAASLCVAAVGTDTGGSIRVPSAFCGVVGIKPTYGRLSTSGVFKLAASMDHVGPIARCVADTIPILQVMMAYDVTDTHSIIEPVPNLSQSFDASIERTKIAICDTWIPRLDAQVESAYKTAISKAENLGGEILEMRSYTTLDRIQDVSSTILLAEAATQHRQLLSKYCKRYGEEFRMRMRVGQKITAPSYISAMQEREGIRREIDRMFRTADLILTPSTQILPPTWSQLKKSKSRTMKMELNYRFVRFTRLASMVGIPALVLPWGYSKEGLPLSIQLLAPRLAEANLLKFAYALERETPELRNRVPYI